MELRRRALHRQRRGPRNGTVAPSGTGSVERELRRPLLLLLLLRLRLLGLLLLWLLLLLLLRHSLSSIEPLLLFGVRGAVRTHDMVHILGTHRVMHRVPTVSIGSVHSVHIIHGHLRRDSGCHHRVRLRRDL